MRREGFSLVEISVVLVVVATMLAGVLPAITESQKSNASSETADRMEAVRQALLTFRAANDRIPCPSDLTLGVNTANFGKEAANPGLCAGGTPAANRSDGAAVVLGGVPTKTLGLPDEYAFDGWGRRLDYHVTYGLTSTAGYAAATAGSINVKDGAATPSDRTTVAAYAILSHGPSGHGAYTRAGTRFNFGTTNTRELENCDCTNAAVNTAYDAVLHQYMATPNTDPKETFDDIVIYGSRSSLDLLADAGVQYWTDAGSNNIRNTNSGNVGIGTATPVSKLHVSLDGTTATAMTGGAAGLSINHTSPQINFNDSDHGDWAIHANSNRLYFIREPWNTTDLVLDGAGNVGIGTATPQALLNIVAPNDTPWGFSLRNATYSGAETGAFRIFQRNSGVTGLWNNNANTMNFDTSGNVGIGTATPAFKLDVDGAVPTNYIARFRNTGTHGIVSYANNYAIVGYNTNAASGAAILGQNTTTSAYGYLGTGLNGVYGLAGGAGYGGYFQSPNNYGMYGRTTSAGHGGVLGYDAQGTYYGILGYANAYSFYGNGVTLSAGGFTTSDARLKEDVHTIGQKDALSKVLQLNPVTFHWKKDSEQYAGEKGLQIGLIAQEAEKVLPDIVRTVEVPKAPAAMVAPAAPPLPSGMTADGKTKPAASVEATSPVAAPHESLNQKLGKTKVVEYTDIIPYLIGAVKELNGKVENLAVGEHAATTVLPKTKPLEVTATTSSAAPSDRMELPRWLQIALVAPWLPWIGVGLICWRRRKA